MRLTFTPFNAYRLNTKQTRKSYGSRYLGQLTLDMIEDVTYREFAENKGKAVDGSAHVLVAASGGGSGGNGVSPTPCTTRVRPAEGVRRKAGPGTGGPGNSSRSRSNRYNELSFVPKYMMGRAGMGLRVGTHGGAGQEGTRTAVEMKYHRLENMRVNCPRQLLGTFEMTSGETCLLSLRIPRPLHKTICDGDGIIHLVHSKTDG